jgi:hypothetical protein
VAIVEEPALEGRVDEHTFDRPVPRLPVRALGNHFRCFRARRSPNLRGACPSVGSTRDQPVLGHSPTITTARRSNLSSQEACPTSRTSSPGATASNSGPRSRDRARQFLRFQPGNVWYRDRNGVPEEVWIYNPNEGIDDTFGTAFYAQDSLDGQQPAHSEPAACASNRYAVSYPEQSFTPEQSDIFAPVSTSQTDIVSLTSPRTSPGFAADFDGEGKTVVKGFTAVSTSTRRPTSALSRTPWVSRSAYIDSPTRTEPGSRPGTERLARHLTRARGLPETRGGAGFVRVDRGLESALRRRALVPLEHELKENSRSEAPMSTRTRGMDGAEVDLDDMTGTRFRSVQ